MPADPAGAGFAGDPPPTGGHPGTIWALKPWWCQPWSILLTGVCAVTGSWLLFGRWWISLPLALAVLAWWGLFLVVVPSAWRAGQLNGTVEPGASRPHA